MPRACHGSGLWIRYCQAWVLILGKFEDTIFEHCCCWLLILLYGQGRLRCQSGRHRSFSAGSFCTLGEFIYTGKEDWEGPGRYKACRCSIKLLLYLWNGIEITVINQKKGTIVRSLRKAQALEHWPVHRCAYWQPNSCNGLQGSLRTSNPCWLLSTQRGELSARPKRPSV